MDHQMGENESGRAPLIVAAAKKRHVQRLLNFVIEIFERRNQLAGDGASEKTLVMFENRRSPLYIGAPAAVVALLDAVLAERADALLRLGIEIDPAILGENVARLRAAPNADGAR